MLGVAVHKDVGAYTEKVVGKMSVRTLACTAGGLAASVAAAAVSYFCLGIEVSDATLPVMACSMPFWLAGFWRPKGLVAEKFIPLYMEHALSDGKLAYRASNDLGTLAQIEKPKPDRRARRLAKRKGAERRDLSET